MYVKVVDNVESSSEVTSQRFDLQSSSCKMKCATKFESKNMYHSNLSTSHQTYFVYEFLYHRKRPQEVHESDVPSIEY